MLRELIVSLKAFILFSFLHFCFQTDQPLPQISGPQSTKIRQCPRTILPMLQYGQSAPGIGPNNFDGW